MCTHFICALAAALVILDLGPIPATAITVPDDTELTNYQKLQRDNEDNSGDPTALNRRLIDLYQNVGVQMTDELRIITTSIPGVGRCVHLHIQCNIVIRTCGLSQSYTLSVDVYCVSAFSLSANTMYHYTLSAQVY
jgi:hypothetical protein